MRSVKLSGIEALLSPPDIPVLLEHVNDPAGPIQQYGMALLSPRPVRRSPIYQRHTIFPYAVTLTEEGTGLLVRQREADAFELVPHLTDGEYLGLLCGRWADTKQPGQYPVWMREIGFVAYKSERVRRAKNAGLEETLRAMHAMLKARHAGDLALRSRDSTRSPIH